MKVKLFPSYGFSANCYLLEINKQAALIDVGSPTPEILEYIAENGNNIKYVLLTHNHFDHICGVEKVLQLTNAKLVLHEKDAKNLCNPNYNLVNLAGLKNPTLIPDIMVENGDVLPLGDKEIKVIHTPGHTLGGVCYVVEDAIFSGDTLFKGTIGRTDFLGGDFSTLCASLQKLANLKGDYKIYPGHEEPTTLSAEVNTNPYFRM